MAYMNQEKKAKIAAALKSVLPADMKVSLTTSNHAISLVILKSKIDFHKNYNETGANRPDGQPFTPADPTRELTINEFWIDRHWSGEVAKLLHSIRGAMNTGNHDRSDIMTDYFDVGHYVNMSIGSWSKPFQLIK